MIIKKIRKISSELEKLVQFNISVERALDLIEATTENLEELVAINTMRECMQELDTNTHSGLFPPLSGFVPDTTNAVVLPS